MRKLQNYEIMVHIETSKFDYHNSYSNRKAKYVDDEEDSPVAQTNLPMRNKLQQ